MSNRATCPKCHREFSSKENLKTRVTGVSSFFSQIEKKRFELLIKKGNTEPDEIKANLMVVCPDCGNEFVFDDYKFYGLFSPAVMKAIIIILLALFIAAPIYILIKDLM